MYRIHLNESHFPAIDDAPVETLSIGEALSRAAADAGAIIALAEALPDGSIGPRWTYRELEAEATQLARALAAHDTPGARIAVWAPNCAEWVLLEYAAAYAGRVLVPLNPAFQAREAQYVLRQSGARVLHYLPEYRGNRIGEMARQLADELGIEHCLLGEARARHRDADDRPLPRVQPLDAAQIQYTSGTTGFPKGAVLHHHGLYRNARDLAGRVGVRRGDVWLNFMPMFHTGGCALSTLGALSARATLVIAAFDAPAMHRLIESERVNVFLGVPTMITALIEAQQQRPRDLSSVRSVLSGGAMVAPELVRRTQDVFPAASVHIVYGQTETSPVISAVWPDASLEDIAGTVGQPLPQVEVAIRDPRSGAVLPLDTTGEICTRGYLGMLRYHDNPEATANTIDADGWLHTGDLGAMDARGMLRVTGRLKEMIIRGGENLFPVEIENALLEHPELAEVAVVGLPDARFGEIVGCFMRARGATRPAPSELIRFCRERLSPQKTPSVWAYVDDWPLTGSGKVRKFRLRELYEQGAIPRLE